MKKILVTGATGFIGRNLCAFLKEKGYSVRAAVRNSMRDIAGVDEYMQVGDIDQTTDWHQALDGVNAVIHLAARVHIMDDKANDPIEAFRKVNVLGTELLAQLAAKAGVKRFIFISSVKVNGEKTEGRGQRAEGRGKEGELKEAFSERDVPEPQDAYGISKLEAENVLKKIADETNLQIVILRIPLVYGPGVKANFKNLIKIASAGLPLPFKGIRNLRSFLYLGNLTHAVIACIDHPKAAGETFMISDGEDISTPELINKIAFALNKKPVLFPFNLKILRAFCKIIGKSEELEKLTGSFLVDSSKIRNLLGWKAPFTMEEGLKETVRRLDS